MRKLISRIMWRIEMFRQTKRVRPLLIWLYNHFEGNQAKIFMFLKKAQTVPELQFREELENVNFDDYLVFTQVERFDSYCKKHNLDLYKTLVVKVKE